MRLVLAVLLIIMSGSIVINIISLTSPDWGEVYGANYGIFECEPCQEFKKNWSWECMARFTCTNNVEPSCSIYNKGYKAGLAYSYLEIVSIVMGIIALEKLLIMSLNKSYGSPVVFYSVLFLHWSSGLIALSLWFAYTGAQFYDGDIKAGTGAITGIIGCVWNTISDLAISISTFKLKFPFAPEIIDFRAKVCKIPSRVCIGISLLLTLISAGFVLASVTSQNWIPRGRYSGSLTRCKNCYDTEELSWTCLAGTECELNSSSDTCSIYSSLSTASTLYLSLSSLTLLFLLLSCQSIISVIASKTINVKILSHLYLFLSIALNLVATVSWVLITGARPNDDCSLGVCGGFGIVYGILSNLFIAPAWIVFAVTSRRISTIKIFKIGIEEYHKNALSTPNNEEMHQESDNFFHSDESYNQSKAEIDENTNRDPVLFAYNDRLNIPSSIAKK
jgi:hypothetical protein